MSSININATAMNRGNVERRVRTTGNGMFALLLGDSLGARLYARAALWLSSASLSGYSRLQPTPQGMVMCGKRCHVQPRCHVQRTTHRPHRPWRLQRVIDTPALAATS